MKKTITTIALSSALLGQLQSAITVYSEDFEGAPTYSVSIAEFNNGTSDHYGRTDGTNIHVDDEGDGAYSGVGGTMFFAAEDADQNGGTFPANLTSPSFSVAGSTMITFSGLFAAGSSGSGTPNYEDDDFVHVYIDFDGADTFATQLLGFEVPAAGASNQHIHQDTDLDGMGDGTQLNDTLTSFSAIVATGGASMARIRVSLDMGATSEEAAFDNLLVEVDQIPEPSSGLLLGLSAATLLLRRRRA